MVDRREGEPLVYSNIESIGEDYKKDVVRRRAAQDLPKHFANIELVVVTSDCMTIN